MSRFTLCSLICILLLIAGGAAHGQVLTYSATGGSGSSSYWNNNWTGAAGLVVLTTSANDLIINSNGTGTARNIGSVQLRANQSANSLTFAFGAAQTTDFVVRANTATAAYLFNLTLTSGNITRMADASNTNILVGQTTSTSPGRVALLTTSGGFTFTNHDNNDLVFQSIISGEGKTVTKEGTGTVIFQQAVDYTGAVASDNTYTGLTTVNAGILDLQKTAGVNAIAGDVLVNAGGTLRLSAADQIANTAGLTVNGGTVNLQSNNETVSEVTLSGGNIAGDGTLTGSSYAVQSGSVNAKLGGAAGLTKTTIGTVTLGANNSYSGRTTISAGKLALSSGGSIAQSTVIDVDSSAVFDVSGVVGYTLANGQTIKGSGTVEGDLTIGDGSVIAPGNSPETLHQIGTQTWANGGTYLWEINSLTGSAGSDPGWDLMSITGGLNITATSDIKFTLQVDSLGALAGWDNTGTSEWKIASATAGITNFALEKFNIDASAFVDENPFSSNGILSLELRNGGTELWMRYAVVPEPSVLGLLGMGLAALWFRCKTRKMNGVRLE